MDVPLTIEGPIRGTVSDRPWGITLAALGLDGRTGQLTLTDDEERRYRVAFYKGMVVGASSPLAVDSAVRVALTTKQITPSQANDLKQRIKIAPNLDEIQIIGRTLRWPQPQEDQLRRDVIIRAAARTFAIDRGTYVLDGRIGDAGIEGKVDVRAIVYFGTRMNLSNERLAFDLRQLGAWFVLKPKTTVDVTGFGFTDAETPILDELRGGTNLASLEAKHRDVVDPRRASAVLYALAVCDAVVCCEPPGMAVTVEVPTVPQPAPPAPQPTPWPPAPRKPAVPPPIPQRPAVARATTPLHPHIAQGTRHGVARPPSTMIETTPWGHPSVHDKTTAPSGVPVIMAHGNESSFVELRTTTVRPNQLAIHEVEQLIAARTKLLDRGADHFTLLGVSPDASTNEVRAAYIELARYLEPRHLMALGIRDEGYIARRLFAQICIAVTVLTDPARRLDYVRTLKR
jgi:hypothetical protein